MMLSRSIGKIFWTKASSCCLKRRAGYLASTCGAIIAHHNNSTPFKTVRRRDRTGETQGIYDHGTNANALPLVVSSARSGRAHTCWPTVPALPPRTEASAEETEEAAVEAAAVERLKEEEKPERVVPKIPVRFATRALTVL